MLEASGIDDPEEVCFRTKMQTQAAHDSVPRSFIRRSSAITPFSPSPFPLADLRRGDAPLGSDDVLTHGPERRTVQRPAKVTTRRVVSQYVARTGRAHGEIHTGDPALRRDLGNHFQRADALSVMLGDHPGAHGVAILLEEPECRAVIALRTNHDSRHGWLSCAPGGPGAGQVDGRVL